MSDHTLRLPEEEPVPHTVEAGGRKVSYRSFENISYCTNPLDPVQLLNIFIPEAYFHGQSVSAYDAQNAPWFLPNTVGGYLPGPCDHPGIDRHTGKRNSIFTALEHGLIVCSIGVRGRTSGKKTTEFFEGSKEEDFGEATGRMCGKAPAFLVDYKAGIRYLRHNRDRLPGNLEHIVTNGTSAGGALSALAGTTGNSPDYEPYLKEIGAAQERDDVFAASCYCPIHNLEHADSAYEWEFHDETHFYRTKHQKTDHGIVRVPVDAEMDAFQKAAVEPLRNLFPVYVNSLGLKDESGKELSMNEDGSGSFADYVEEQIILSAKKEAETHDNEKNRPERMTPGSFIDEQDYLHYDNGVITGIDRKAYIHKITRMKAAPAFDSLTMDSPENEEFGSQENPYCHFTRYSYEHSLAEHPALAEEHVIHLMNPTLYIREESARKAKHFRIRHGAFDRDTSCAIPIILALLLKMEGIDTDFFLPWGIPHAGDYDLEDLMRWIDHIVS